MMITGTTCMQKLQAELLTQYDAIEAKAIARVAAEEIFGKLLLQTQEALSATLLHEWEMLSTALKNGIPLQYALGRAWFMDLVLKVSPAVLIPRPETEELVEYIIRENRNAAMRILDIGTGSGCIPIALKRKFPHAQLTAWDVSDEALAIARENAAKYQTDIQFVQQDVFEPSAGITAQRYQLIVSNPPYIHPSEKKEMHAHVLDHEPHLALFTPETDVLIFYRRMITLAGTLLDGQLWFEVHAAHASAVAELLHAAHFSSIRILRDMQGKDRFVTGVHIA